jgi:hypothetical protein
MEKRLGTWNVRTVYKAGGLKAVLPQIQHYYTQITAVQEPRWMGKEAWGTKAHTILQSGNQEGKREFGVTCIVNKDMKGNILAFTPVNHRICVLRMKTRFFNLSFINVHAPTEHSEVLQKNEFYYQLERTYDSAPSNDFKIIMEDLNAKVDKGELYIGTIGKQSLHNQ